MRLVVHNSVGERVVASSVVEAGRFARLQGLQSSVPNLRGWCWQPPAPWGNGLVDAEFVSAQQGWAVGDAGLILRSDDGSAHCTLVPDTATPMLRQIRFADATNGWAEGDGGTTLSIATGRR